VGGGGVYLASGWARAYLVAIVVASFINEAFFQRQGELILWLLTLGSMAMLLVGADRAVHAAVKLAKALGISTVIIGATVVSLGTTAPEACVSVMAAWRGNPGLALGNSVGSVICDTALIFGLCCCLTRLPLDRFVLRRHGWLQLGAGALLTAVVFVGAWVGGVDGAVIPRWVGYGFLGLLVGYLYISFRWARQHPEMIPSEARQSANKISAGTVAAMLGVLGLGLALVLAGSDALIGSVKELCIRNNVPDHIVAVTLVAFGTSLPELATALTAIIKGHPGLLVGNVIGADILNVLFVIGASASASELAVPPLFLQLHLPVMMLSLLLLRGYIFASRDRFSRWQGIPLLAIYIGYLALLGSIVGATGLN